ncbi:MAG: hypothetical protein M1821_008623 [Bathelium mastoideum]|nr:MAG: hypothetical protein M1821_008623 [Bathelium mastoideum]
MAEAIGLTASIITLLQVSYTVAREAFSDVNRIVGAQKEMRNISNGAGRLDETLVGIEALATTEPELGASGKPVRLLQNLAGTLNESRGELESLQRRLKWPSEKSAFKRGMAALQWPLKEKEVQKSLDRFREFTESLSLSLQAETLSTVRDVQHDAARTKRMMEERHIADIADRTRGWLRESSPWPNQATASALHEPGTSLWLFRRPEYQRFKNANGDVIWLNGILGSGKTVLCSSIIEDIQSLISSDSTAVLAYFYFDFNDASKQKVSSFVRTLLAQFVHPERVPPKPISDLYARYKGINDIPPVGELLNALISTSNLYSKVYIVCDALDECAERRLLLDFLRDLIKRRPTTVNMLFTSRQERDIEACLQPLVSSNIMIQAANVEADIRLYVSNVLQRDENLRILPVSLHKDITEGLATKAEGMFRWVFCQIIRLQECKSAAAVRKTLRSLPTGLDGTYDRILENIDPEEKPKARSILAWLAFSNRPLFLDQIAEVAAIDAETRQLCKEERLFDKTLALDFCPGLIRLCEDIPRSRNQAGHIQYYDKVIRLAHFSVKEYLVSIRFGREIAGFFYLNAEIVNREIAETCLQYLLMLNESDSITPSCFQEYPLLSYAARHWIKHLERVPDGKHKNALQHVILKLFIGKPPCFSNWLRILEPTTLSPYRVLEDRELDSDGEGYALLGTPLYYASRFGLLEVVRQILEDQDYSDIDEIGGLMGSPLTAAVNGEVEEPVSEDHRRIVDLLVGKGAEVNKQGPLGGNTLRWALVPGNETILRQLIAFGGDVHAKDDMGLSLLHHAVDSENVSSIEILLEHGADLEAMDARGKTPLFRALDRWPKDTALRFLLQQGADIDKRDNAGKTLLHYCVSQHKPDCIIALLRAGASTHIADDQGRLPFDPANLDPQKRRMTISALAAIPSTDPMAQRIAEWMPLLNHSTGQEARGE